VEKNLIFIIIYYMKHLIIGNGVAGITAAFTIKEREPAQQVTVISGETDYYFSRTALMYIAMDELRLEDTEPYERRTYGDFGIDLVFGRVEKINTAEKSVEFSDGRDLSYDRLLLATGALPKQLFPEEKKLEGIVNLVSYSDLEEISSLLREVPDGSGTAAVIGGGLIGVELAEVLQHRGLSVRFLIRGDHFFRSDILEEEGRFVERHLRNHGVEVYTGCGSFEIESENGRVIGVQAGGSLHPCDILGIAVGVEANTALARASGIPSNRGILCNWKLQNKQEDIFTAGDCAEIETGGGRENFRRTIWYSARDMGETAGRNMLGDGIAYDPAPWYNSAKFFELEYTGCGQIMPQTPEEKNYFFLDEKAEQSVRVVHNDNEVLGFSMIGSRWDHSVLLRFIEEHRPLEYFLEHSAEAAFEPEMFSLPKVKAAAV